jgi:hypothetical protein
MVYLTRDKDKWRTVVNTLINLPGLADGREILLIMEIAVSF